MKESYSEGPANHGGPESCAGTRKGAGEALTGEHTGGVLKGVGNGVPTLLSRAEGTLVPERVRAQETLRSRRPPARVETPCARTGRSPGCHLGDGPGGRAGKLDERNPAMDGGKSDSSRVCAWQQAHQVG